MPSPTPGKESSGGDAESVLPDSASLGDDLLINSKSVILIFLLHFVLSWFLLILLLYAKIRFFNFIHFLYFN